MRIGAGKAMRRGWTAARGAVTRGRDWAALHLPFGVRLVVGVLLMLGGLLAFLPVLGLWMLPLGLAIAAIDVLVIWNWSLRQVRRYRPRPPRK